MQARGAMFRLLGKKNKQTIDESLGNFSPKLESDSSINKAASVSHLEDDRALIPSYSYLSA